MSCSARPRRSAVAVPAPDDGVRRRQHDRRAFQQHRGVRIMTPQGCNVRTSGFACTKVAFSDHFSARSLRSTSARDVAATAASAILQGSLVKLALLSDVYGNGHAMDTVIADARVHGVDRLWVLSRR